MRRRLIVTSMAGLVVACYSAQESSCGSGPTPILVASPSPSPSPSASPSPTVKAESCAIEYMILQPRDGFVLAHGQTGRISLTPYQTVTNSDGTVAQREVSEACNLPRTASIIWTSSSAAVTVGTGFEPLVTRIGVGTAQITATLEGKISNAVTVR